MRAALIVNPVAGHGRAPRAAARLADLLHRRGVGTTVATPSSGRIGQCVDELIATGVEVVVAVGGDGTVHAVVQSLAGKPVALGVVPVGTGNDIAGQLGLVTMLDTIADAIAGRRVRVIDCGEARCTGTSAEVFVGVLSTGFDSSVNERANRMRWASGRARYLAATLRELRRFAPIDYRVRIDDLELAGTAMLVCIANAGQYGGGMRICPGASIDDGRLDVTWVDQVAIPEFLRVLPRVFSGSHVRHPAVRTFTGASVSIEGPGQTAYADGERLGPLPVDVRIVPGSLRVIDTRPAGET